MQVLIIDRDLNPTVWYNGLHEADSCGDRTVWFYNLQGPDYKTAQDLPDEAIAKIQWHVYNLRKSGHNVRLCVRRDDPGPGIYIPELDRSGY